MGHPLSSKQLPLIVSPSNAASGKCCLVSTKVLNIISRLCHSTDSIVCSFALRLTVSLLTSVALCTLILPYPSLPRDSTCQRALFGLQFFQVGLRVTSCLSGRCQSTSHQSFDQRELVLVVTVSFKRNFAPPLRLLSRNAFWPRPCCSQTARTGLPGTSQSV